MVITVADEIADLTETTTGVFDPPHSVTDTAKADALVVDMAARGWQGPPLVVAGGAGGWSLTGAHRIAAVVHLWNEEGVEVLIPYVDIADLCERYGIDWDALRDEHGDEYQAATELKHWLPREVVDYLGFDVDGAL